MPESSQPPRPPVSTVARILATVALLHGSTLNDSLHGSGPDDSSPNNNGSGLDVTTATALVDAVAYLISTGDPDGAEALLRLATTDPDTIAAAHVALHIPARRPTRAAPTGEPSPPLPRRTPGPYRDPGQPDPAGRSNATPTATGPRLTATTGDPGARLVDAGRTGDPGGSEENGNSARRPPLSESQRWQEATAAQVLLLDYAVTDAEGQVTGVYTPVPIVHPPGWCDHLDTICGGCLTGWSEDHTVAVFRHGIDGAATGCRCPVCRTTVPGGSTAPNPTRSPAQLDRHPGTGQIPGNTSGSTASRDASWFGAEGS